MSGTDGWDLLERAWSLDPHCRPRKTCLPALIAAADRAVAAAVINLTREYDSLPSLVPPSLMRGADGATPRILAVPPTTAEDPENDGHCRITSQPTTGTAGDSATDWMQLYASLCLIQAPMVRCSRPAFRQVCRAWGTRVSYTHMLVAESFVKSPHARHAEFARYEGEEKLIAQLAAKSGPAAAQAALLLQPYCDAIDLNCGCPQRWAIKEGIGAALLEKPELVADMVRSIRNAGPGGFTSHDRCDSTSPLPCVVKMRVMDDLRCSVDFARQCEAAGASWVTVHGRTPTCHSSAPVRFDAVRLIRENLSIPVVLNGGVSDVGTAVEAALRTGCGGLMAGNGLLDNPAMFYCSSSRAALEAELSFNVGVGSWAPRDDAAEVAAVPAQEVPCYTVETGKEFTPIQPVSFLWTPSDDISSAVGRSMLPWRLDSHLWQAAVTPREVISDFVRAAIRTDLMVPTTVQQVLRMARLYLSPAERNHLALLRSNISVLQSLMDIGVYVEGGHITCA